MSSACTAERVARYRNGGLDERGLRLRRGDAKRTGIVIGSPEVAAYEAGFIDRAQLEKLAEPLLKSGYGEYLRAF